MIVTYAVTAAIVGAGGADRAREQPVLALAAASKVAANVVLTTELACEEWADNHALCS